MKLKYEFEPVYENGGETLKEYVHTVVATLRANGLIEE